MPINTRGLFIFHRDFRISDNIALNNAGFTCDKLYTCFIFTPEQVTRKNSYKSNNSVQFMIESLRELNDTIKTNNGELLCFYGKQTVILKHLINDLNLTHIFFNDDYSPYAIQRDNETKQLCNKLDVKCITCPDYYLYEPGTVLVESSKNAYKKYTPFYNAILNNKVSKPNNVTSFPFSMTSKELKYVISLKEAMDKFVKPNNNILVHGGRTQAHEKLKKALRVQGEYDLSRDFFTYKTTHLSAYIKFGCLSIREVYHAFKQKFGLKHGLIRELIWREFFAHVLYCYPEVVGQSYQPKYRSLNWSQSKTNIEKWKNGMTGFPLVDACMREMNTTGYMHNRGRMTTANFLIKTLLIDWRIGEQYFAQQLTDYDIASNNGNWQGISGTGVDMKPYFRDMNPWIQSFKFDVDAEYIKKWVPELKDVLARDIHSWDQKYNLDKYKDIKYPKPIVDYYSQKEKMLEMYKAS
ncbi:deoxyribodipyrimidine photo-lyase [Pelagibacteraceae bacterium]|nr:deoxyribodipyrimidine photo-lyase [Pelagibacteraceae bacterium]